MLLYHLHYGVFAVTKIFTNPSKSSAKKIISRSKVLFGVIFCFPKSSMKGEEGEKVVTEHCQTNLTGFGKA